jgi:beta-galactosidase
MKHGLLVAALFLTLFSAVLPARAAATPGMARTVTVGDGHFIVDGKPVQIISGSIHFARVPRADWRDRLLKAKAMGLNAISVYVFWNVQEPHPGQWDFKGQYDVARFIRIAQQVGLYVILRPGPYACAEWSMGGYPAWLWQNAKVKIRSTDPAYLRAAQAYMDHLGRQLKPLLWTHGGPIIAVQVENEYGSFGRSRAYLEAVRRMVTGAGLGSVVLYTADGPGLWGGSLPELPEAIDVGPGGVRDGVKQLLQYRPHARLVYVAEYYPGWFDQWGQPHHHGAPLAEQLKDLRWILSRGYSVNLYMFHGGTDWGFLNGANDNAADTDYAPQTTSYDYAAPLNEAGDPTPAYYAFRRLFRQYAPEHRLPPVPGLTPLISIPAFRLPLSASLGSDLPRPKASQYPLSFEDFGQQTGFVLYRTQIHGPMRGTLDVGEARDYDIVYLNGKQIGTLDRRLRQHELALDVSGSSARLEILVEDMGRINYGPLLPDDPKGLIAPVLWNGKRLTEWENFSLPMQTAPRLRWRAGKISAPAFHRGSFTLAKVGDTYLDVSAIGKGLLWVNGHAVGRIWNIGPQQSDYVPACWLHKGKNTVTVLDLDRENDPEITGTTHPVFRVNTH